MNVELDPATSAGPGVSVMPSRGKYAKASPQRGHGKRRPAAVFGGTGT
jgi:hypothetical protein